MNPVGNPLAMLSGVSGLPETIKNVATAPLARWNQSSTTHKFLAAGAGAALAYYLHRRGMADAAVAVAGVAGAYGASMVMHLPRAAQGAPPQTAAGALPPAQIAAMNEQAQAAMNNMNGGNQSAASAALSGAMAQPSHVPGTAGPIPIANGGAQPQQAAAPVSADGKWALLAANL